MNIFILDKDIKKSATYLPNIYVVKMPVEATQMLCTVLYISGCWEDWMYKPTHINHPCTQWVYQSLDNWLWLKEYTIEMGKEYTYRYGKEHKSVCIAEKLPNPLISSIGLTEFVKCVPHQYIMGDVVESYRKYLIGEKGHLRRYKNREEPNWWV